ncbi:ABC transporter B family member 15-like [Vicia villosa]|uniref:ABC transporter B family member 15-like n=1 Tax=Vicia villosa TaxID=3911 RepID=UPI00273CE749|nr:ABC transporter B family member 15-like [Vicia villosa]
MGGVGEKKERNKNVNGSIWSIFMHADTQDWFLMVLGTIGSIGEGIITPLVLLISSRMMNNYGTSSSTDGNTFIHNINKNVVAWIYLACASFVVCFFEGYCWTRTSGRQAAKMRCRYLKAVLRQDVAYFDLQVTSTSEIITSVSNDTLLIQDVISEKVPNFLMNISSFIASYTMPFIMIWRLAIVAFPFSFLLVIPGLIYGKTLMSLSRKIREEYNQAGTVAEQTLSSIRTVYSFVGEQKSMNAFSKALEGNVELGLKQGLAKGLAIGSNGFVFAIWAFLCYYGSKMVMYHGAQGGTVFAVGASITVGGLALGASLSNMKYFSEAITAGERIKRVIERVPKIDSNSTKGEILENISGEVEFDNVEFSYPTRPETIILKKFCLKIPAGKAVALVGESGSGKSTVVSLLQRFYDPIGGEIRLDGVAIHKLKIKWLRSMMGLVSQEPALFATSIKENILFGKEDATEEEIVEAAKICNAHDFISLLPNGYNTQVGERGVQLSGGQKQRIAIARAIIKKPRILLLDEATSALDTESERLVQQALDNATTGCTAIIIAHRLSTIQNADIVAVVHRGKVTEIGSHDELLQNDNNLYASLVRLQQTKTESGETDAATFTNTQSSSLVVDPTKLVDDKISSNNHNVSIKNSDIDTDKTVSFWRLLALNAPEWKQAVWGSLNAMVFGAIQPTFSFTIGSMISVYFYTDHEEIKRKTRIYSLVFFGFSLITLVANIGQHYNFAYMGEYLTKRVRESMLSNILSFEVGWFDKDENSSGAISSRLANDANVVRSLVGDRMSLLVQTFSAVATAYTMGLIISWRLALVTIASQPILIACFYTKGVLLKSLSSKSIKAQEQSSKLASEAVSNLRTITAFSSQDRILKMLDEAQHGPIQENFRQAWFAGFGLGFSQFFMSCSWALGYWYGGKLLAEGKITKKALFESFMVVVSTGRVIGDAGSMTKDISKGADTVSSIFAILDRRTNIEPDDADRFKPNTLTGQIDFCDVHFAYPARPDVIIFQGFSITIEAGKSTALVGQSGSGKSTIIGLIERFYDPLQGSVTIDGMNIKSYNLKSLRKHIALVSQEPTLINGTIRDNIAYGTTCDKIDEAEIIEAARVANAHDFIASLRDGYETWCGDKGMQLSGGQKQRIAIARAMLKNPKVLLLDEATSALDNKSEKVVQEALDKVMVGRTSVVVAHRLSTIQNCDVIAVLEKGKMVEIGTHKSLLANGPSGAYYSLVKLQTKHAVSTN